MSEQQQQKEAELMYLKAENQHLKQNNQVLKTKVKSLSSSKKKTESQQEDNPESQEDDAQEVLFVTSAVKKQVQSQQLRFEEEILTLQEQLESADMENADAQASILNKARKLHQENEILKETLNRMQVVSADQVQEPSELSEEEELARMRYFEALRRAHFEEQMRQMQEYRYSDSQSREHPYRTPNAMQWNYEDMYSYGSEVNTASANYRPRNSSTCLRRKPANTVSNVSQNNATKPLRSSLKKPQKSEKSAQMDPAEDSFHVSPLHSEKYAVKKVAAPADENERQVSKHPTSNVTLSGVSEFDYLGSETGDNPEKNQDSKKNSNDQEEEEEEDLNPTRKSLEKDFIEAEQVNADEAYSPVAQPRFEDDEAAEVPDFQINPVSTYSRRPRESYAPKMHSPLRQRPNGPETLPLQFEPRESRQQDYKQFLQRKMEYRVNKNNFYSPDRTSPGSAARRSFSPTANRHHQGFSHSYKLRDQAQNLYINTPGANRRNDPEKELYSDFKIKFGMERPEDSNLVFSPEAEFRRDQIIKYKKTGEGMPGFPEQAYQYGSQIGSRANVRRGRLNHDSRFP